MGDFLTNRQNSVNAKLSAKQDQLNEAVALGDDGERSVYRIYTEFLELQEEAAKLVNMGKLYPPPPTSN